MKAMHIAVVGATGIVGRELLDILIDRDFPIASLKLLASAKSAGETITVGEESLMVEPLTAESFKNMDLAFFATNTDVSKEFCPIAVKAGAVCIDKSSAYRMDPEIPLVVPEINKDDICLFDKRRIIASPNCTATPVAQVLSALQAHAPLKRVVVCSYQAVSGAGQAGVDELEQQIRDLFNMRDASTEVFGKRIAFNVLPCIPARDSGASNGSTDEEVKVVQETRRLLGKPALPVSVTCARVPVFNGHSMALHIEFSKALSADQARDILGQAPGVLVLDDMAGGLYPTPLDATGEDVTVVGRIRIDESVPHGLILWLSSDNLRTGAALNAVKVAEILVSEYLS